MAKKKNLSTEQILGLIEAGGSTKGFVNPLQALLALAQNPERLARLQQKQIASADPYARFDATYSYDPSTNINDVGVKYSMMEDKYQPLVQAFWTSAREYGGNPATMNKVRMKLRDDPSFGLDVTEKDSLLQRMYKDLDKFTTSEASRQKAQYKAWLGLRKDKGITATDPNAVASQLLGAQTGIMGLEELPTSLEDLTKRKTDKFREAMLARGQSEKRVSEMADLFSKTFMAKAKEKKISPTMQGLAAAIKKNLMGG